jgi:hypothetical protein
MTEPNKEPVRIPFPARPDKTPPSPSAARDDTVRIVLPSRTPAAPVRRVPPKITPLPDKTPESIAVPSLLQPLPKPPGPDSSAQSRAALSALPPASDTGRAGSAQSGPKNETARINILPTPTPIPPPSISMAVAPKLDPFDAMPRSFRWGLFSFATVNFLIQIWIYVVS